MEASEILNKVGSAIVKAMQEELESNGSVGSGNLKNNITYNLPDAYSVQVVMPLYGKFVDEGTKPHMPPVSSIEKWAEAKGLNAWAVAINISKYGTKAHPFVYKFTETIDKYKDEIEHAIGISIGDSLYEYLKQGENIK